MKIAAIILLAQAWTTVPGVVTMQNETSSSGSYAETLCTLETNPARLSCEGPMDDKQCHARRASNQVCIVGLAPSVDDRP